MAKKPSDWPVLLVPANQDKSISKSLHDSTVPRTGKMYDFPSPVGAKLVILKTRRQKLRETPSK